MNSVFRMPRVALGLLLPVACISVVLGLTTSGSAATTRRHQSRVVGRVMVCGARPQPGRPDCHPGRRGGQVRVSSHGKLVTVAAMKHGRFSIQLWPGRYGLVVKLKHSERSQRRTIRVTAHRTAHVGIKIWLK